MIWTFRAFCIRWTIRVAHLAKHLWTKTPHPFCRAILSKEGFLFGVRLFLPAGEVCSWRMAASLCACIEQSNKCTFVDLINALKEWDWKKIIEEDMMISI